MYDVFLLCDSWMDKHSSAISLLETSLIICLWKYNKSKVLNQNYFLLRDTFLGLTYKNKYFI